MKQHIYYLAAIGIVACILAASAPYTTPLISAESEDGTALAADKAQLETGERNA